MQPHPTSAELCALLDNVLQTIHLLKQALDQCVPPPAAQAKAPPPEPVPPVDPVPVEPKRVAPVLTIKLSDLLRAADEAKKRRQPQAITHLEEGRAWREQRRQRHLEVLRAQSKRSRVAQALDRKMQEVEVVYKGGLKRVS